MWDSVVTRLVTKRRRQLSLVHNIIGSKGATHTQKTPTSQDGDKHTRVPLRGAAVQTYYVDGSQTNQYLVTIYTILFVVNFIQRM